MPNNNLTIIITTHNTKKLNYNNPLSPPSTGLLERTWDSFKKRAYLQKLRNRILIFNYHDRSDDEYLNNCNKFAIKYGFKLITDRSPGYKGVRCAMPSYVKTPYIFHIEHDWELCEIIDTYNIINIFNKYPFVKYIRLNKRQNIIFPKKMASGRVGADLFMKPDNRIDNIPLCMTPHYSNNPHFERIETLKNLYIPSAKSSTIYEGKNGGAGGFEQPIQEASYDYFINNNNNIYKHNNIWGTYCYGGLNFGPAIKHFGV